MRRFKRVGRGGITAVTAGCFVCHGGDAHWFSKNGQAIAARHTDATGHKTWVDVISTFTYSSPDGQGGGD